MICYILNSQLSVIEVIDDYYSLIWTERYDSAGDWELALPIGYSYNYALWDTAYFAIIPDSDVYMLIETLKIQEGEDREEYVVSGESAEALLRRRSTDALINVDNPAESILYPIVLTNFVTASDADRQMDVLKGTTSQLVYGGLNYVNQLDPQPVYDICVDVCMNTGMGFTCERSSETRLKFVVYQGTDRSAEQIFYPRVVFGGAFGNVTSASHIRTTNGEINTVIVLSDDTVYPKITTWLTASEPADIDRREDVIETSVDRGEFPNDLTNAEVLAILTTRGKSHIRENKILGVYEATLDTTQDFRYGQDFFMGDIVQVFIGAETTQARVVEVVKSYSQEGNIITVGFDFESLVTI